MLRETPPQPLPREGLGRGERSGAARNGEACGCPRETLSSERTREGGVFDPDPGGPERDFLRRIGPGARPPGGLCPPRRGSARAPGVSDLLIHPADRPLVGSVPVPGDKSIAHRAILLAGLASGTSRVE